MTRISHAYEGMQTPWGRADYVKLIAPGIWSVGTPSHGGIKVERKFNAEIPDYMRQPGGWYEEDCDWAIPFVVFEKTIIAHGEEYAIKSIEKGSHRSTLENWHPDAFEKFYGVPASDDSYMKKQKKFEKESADKWVVRAAWGDWQSGIPKGMVGVVATLGGKRAGYGEVVPEKWFIIPDEEYAKRESFGFIVDTAKHTEVAKFIS